MRHTLVLPCQRLSRWDNFQRWIIPLVLSCLLLPLTSTATLASGGDSGMSQRDAKELQVEGMRKNLADTRIFDRIAALADDPQFQQLPIEEKIRKARNTFHSQLAYHKRMYALKWSLIYGSLTVGMGTAVLLGPSLLAPKENAPIVVGNPQGDGATAADPQQTLSKSRLDEAWKQARHYTKRYTKHLEGRLTDIFLFGVFLTINVPGRLTAFQLLYTFRPPELLEEKDIINYASKKLLLHPSIQTYIEEEVIYAFWRNQSHEAQLRIGKILEKALKLPIAKKKLQYRPEMLQQELKHYPQEVVDALDLFALNEITLQNLVKPIETRFPVYFVGKPGTGKSFAAKKLAEIMDTKLSIVSLDGATIDDIVGTSFETTNAQPGRILEAITSAVSSIHEINYQNQILFIDEFDRLLLSNDKRSEEVLSFMLKLLDPDNRYFYSPYLKTKIRLPDTIILAGNFDIEELIARKETLEALASRLDIVRFKGYSLENKKQLIWQHTVPSLIASYKSSGNRHFQGLTAEENQRIDAFLEQDQDLGLRSSEKYVARIIQESFYRQTREHLRNAPAAH